MGRAPWTAADTRYHRRRHHSKPPCSAEPRGLCGDLRPFMDSQKLPRVSRQPLDSHGAGLGSPIDSDAFPLYKNPMPRFPMPQGALAMLVLRVLRTGPLHGYAIAQRIRRLSDSVLEAEEGSLYPALQRLLLEGWVRAEWGISETNRRVRLYELTGEGRKQLKRELVEYKQVTAAIQAILRTA